MSAHTLAGALALLLALAGPALAGDGAGSPAEAVEATEAAAVEADAAPAPDADPAQLLPIASPVVDAPDAPATTRSGLEIYRSFRDGLAEPACEPGASSRWRQHFAHAPDQLATPGSDVLPLFGYIVDRLRAEHLPTEYALIPFVESGYRPGARSPQGPAGLWQFITLTARNHKVPVRAGYDGRLSPVDSTDAAMRYLKTLHGMFAGNWRLAVMAYNAGEYRLLGALRRSGQRPADADPATLPMPSITMAYVRKLHALSCLLEEAEGQDAWLQALDRPVPVLTVAEVPAQVASLDALARRQGGDAARLRRLNPVFGDGRIARGDRTPRVLLPSAHAASLQIVPPVSAIARANPPRPAAAPADDISDAMADASALLDPPAAQAPRTHTVARGDSAWKIARRYGISVADLLARNGLDARAVLRPGMALAIDTVADGATATAVAE